MNLDLLNVKPVVTFTYRLTKDDIVKTILLSSSKSSSKSSWVMSPYRAM